MSHQELTETTPAVPAEAESVLPFTADYHRDALARLRRAFTEARPLAVLIGEGRSAASFVIRSFLDGIGDDVDVVRITETGSDANVGMREIIHAVGLDLDPNIMSDADLEDVFTMFLSVQTVRDRRTVICFEDAEDSGPGVLDTVHRLVELETEGKYGLMMILSGKLSLDELLREPPLNTLDTQAAQCIAIAPFTQADTREYVRRRIEATGDSDTSYMFAFDAITLIHELSEGVPDAVINLYSRCIQLADEQDATAVTTDLVMKADVLRRQGNVTQLSDAEAGPTEVNGAAPAGGRLIARMNGELVQEYLLKQGQNLIGRGKLCDIRLASHAVSRRHALVLNSSNGTALVDLSSKNGTFVGGRPIKHHSLCDSDVITVGGCMIEYIAGDDQQAQ